MDVKQRAKELHRLADQLENVAWDLCRDLVYGEPNVYEPPEPLTYQELDFLLESEEYEETGVYVYVQELPYSFVTVAVLDWFDGEVLAVYGIENVLHGRDYGKTWVAYRTPPVFDNE